MPDGAARAVVLLEPVQGSLRQGHDGTGEAQQSCRRCPLDMRQIEVADVHAILDDV